MSDCAIQTYWITTLKIQLQFLEIIKVHVVASNFTRHHFLLNAHKVDREVLTIWLEVQSILTSLLHDLFIVLWAMSWPLLLLKDWDWKGDLFWVLYVVLLGESLLYSSSYTWNVINNLKNMFASNCLVNIHCFIVLVNVNKWMTLKDVIRGEYNLKERWGFETTQQQH
jgi:hypothetical protein